MKFTTPRGAASAPAATTLVAPILAATAPIVRPEHQRQTRRHTASATRRAARAVFAVVVAAAALGWGAAPASAHNSAVGSSPAADAVVTEQPGLFSVTTSDLLLDLGGSGSGTAMIVTGPASAPLFYGDGCATVSGATIETAAQLGAAGEYTVIWQTVSTDGHSISDEFTFDWKPAQGQSLADGAATAPSCGIEADASTAEATADDGVSAASDSPLLTVAWIGAALGAVLLAVAVTLLVLRRKRRR